MKGPLKLALPLPPSVWKLYTGTGKNRRKSKEYKAWIAEAGLLVKLKTRGHKCIECNVFVSIKAVKPDMKRRDIDNIIKAPLDLLTEMQVIKDDSNVLSLYVAWVGSGPPLEITITEQKQANA